MFLSSNWTKSYIYEAILEELSTKSIFDRKVIMIQFQKVGPTSYPFDTYI